jgi:hypothetical protein
MKSILAVTLTVLCLTACRHNPTTTPGQPPNTAPGLPRDYGRAATPIFRSSGVVFPDTNGRPIGAYSCATSSPSGNTVRGVYIKLEFPIFTDLKASFNGQAVEYWATPPVPHSLYEGPRATPMHFWFEKKNLTPEARMWLRQSPSMFQLLRGELN